MTIAGKHLDPIMGIDTHVVMIPTPAGAPIPTPMPNPYVGIVMAASDYLPFIGASVWINGLPRAQAGTGGIQITPHIPLGGPIVPPASGESEVFMGSATVAVDGDAGAFFGVPVLSCQTVGIPAPFRPKGAAPKSLMLPTSTLLSVPMGSPVLIGGPPTISLQGLGQKAAFAGLGKLGSMIRKAQQGTGAFGRAMRALTRRASALGEALAKALHLGPTARNRLERAICTVTGHPVDVATGKVFTDHVDLTLPGPIPFQLERVWYSTSTYRGPLGHGWHHTYDAALYVRADVILHRARDGRMISFPAVGEGEEHFHASERLTLLRERGGYAIRTRDRQLLHFRDIGRDHGEYSLTEIEDPIGNRVLLRYDERGRLIELRDSAGRLLTFVHDERDRMVEIHVPDPERPDERVLMLRYRYDAEGNLHEVHDALGHVARYAYRDHLLRQETDRNGLNFYFEYDAGDADARCTRTWGDGGIYDHKLTYDDARGITTVTNSLGFKTQYEHRDGLVIQTVDAHGGISRCEYDEDDRLVVQTNPLGLVTRYSYDSRGNTLGVTYPDGAQNRMTYDAEDRCIEVVDAIGGIWKLEYDEQGRLLSRVDPLGRRIAYRYSAKFLQVLIDPLGVSTPVTFDAAGNLTRIELPGGAVHSFEFDRLGRLIARIDPAGNRQRRFHDLLGRITRVEEADGNVRELQHDPEGNVNHARDANHDVHFTYQGMSRLASRTEAGTTVAFEYDTEEQLTGITNEHGYVYRFELGATGDVRVESGFDGVRRIYQRDLAGRVTAVERANGLVSTYQYDPAGRVVAVDHSDGARETYAYRPDGALIQAGNSSSSLIFVRDEVGRIVRELQGGQWVASEYNARGHRVRLTSSMGADQRTVRDALGNVMGVSHSRREHGQAFEVRIARDILGLEIERDLPGGMRSRWLRDSLGRPQRQEIFAGNLVQRERRYTWDVGSRLRMVFDSQFGSVRYGHDRLGNLAFAQYEGDPVRELRMPDAVGNLFRREDRSDREYGPAGQLLKSVDDQGRVLRYDYDAEGNLIRKLRDDDELWQYRWAADGMLKTVVRPDGSEVAFAYDAIGRRVSKTYRAQTTRWVWDGNVPLHEWVEGDLAPNVSGNRQRWMDAATQRREAELSAHLQRGPPSRGSRQQPITWLFEPESFTPMAKLVGEEQLAIVCDHLGAPIAMHDAAGTEVWSAQLGTWGELRERNEAGGQPCPFRWPGQYEDVESGLYYNRFRYYDDEAGEYLSQDPLRVAGGLALYAYTRDPSSSIDPLGLSACMSSDPRVSDAIASGRPIIVVGRRMQDRVIPMAEALKNQGANVHTYSPRSFKSSPGNIVDSDLEANRKWLKYWAKDKNALVVDIGHDPANPSNISPFYELEQRSLYTNWSNIDVVRHDPGF